MHYVLGETLSTRTWVGIFRASFRRSSFTAFQVFLKKSVFPNSWPSTITYRIRVPVRLFIFEKKSSLYALVKSCTVINFDIQFSTFLQNGREATLTPVQLFHPVRLLKFQNLLAYMLISSYTLIRYSRLQE